MATTAKPKNDKATVRQLELFKAVVKATYEINETSFMHGQTKSRLNLKVDSTAKGTEFYVPNIFRDRILLTKDCHPDIRGWADQEFVNNKSWCEALVILSSSLLLGTYPDHMGNEYQIPQTMTGLGIISIPLFSPRNVKIIPVIYFTSIGISYPAFGSRSDQRYVPTLRTFLR